MAQGQHSLILHDSCTVGPSLCIQIEGIFCKKKCEDVAAERKDASLKNANTTGCFDGVQHEAQILSDCVLGLVSSSETWLQ